MKNRLCDIAWNLRRSRESKNFTQEYMAAQLDISPTAYRNLENRSSRISLKRLFDIANILDISVSELLELSTHTTGYRKNEALTGQEMLHAYEQGASPYLLIEKKTLDRLTRQLADLVRQLSEQNTRKKRQ